MCPRTSTEPPSSQGNWLLELPLLPDWMLTIAPVRQLRAEEAERLIGSIFTRYKRATGQTVRWLAISPDAGRSYHVLFFDAPTARSQFLSCCLDVFPKRNPFKRSVVLQSQFSGTGSFVGYVAGVKNLATADPTAVQVIQSPR